jgi:CheY-like chemotaxis protein
VYLRVTDNGTGMDQNTLMRIFDPFFTTKFAGRGLGLAAALGIIQTHEGALQVESTPGRGTSFTLFLPAEAAVAVAPATKHEAVSRENAGACVLVVDDEREVRAVTTRMLESSGYRVRQAVDGVEALHVYENDGATIDLVILDMPMPRLGGEETWKQLRQIDPEVRVLFCSGYSEESADDLLLEDGARVGFLHKPFRKAKLLEDIEALLGEGPARGA